MEDTCLSLQSAIDESKSLVQCMKEESGSPGVCVAVSVDGKDCVE